MGELAVVVVGLEPGGGTQVAEPCMGRLAAHTSLVALLLVAGGRTVALGTHKMWPRETHVAVR